VSSNCVKHSEAYKLITFISFDMKPIVQGFKFVEVNINVFSLYFQIETIVCIYV